MMMFRAQGGRLWSLCVILVVRFCLWGLDVECRIQQDSGFGV